MDDIVEKLAKLLRQKRMMLVTAESCTGGLIAATITQKPGISDVFERGYVTYSNQAKIDCLGVSPVTLEKFGAVSPQAAEEMAIGALKNSRAQLAVSVTGIAGPDGGSAEKPVGLVYFGYALSGGSSGSIEHQFEGDRTAIQSRAARTALHHILSIIEPDNAA